MRRAGFTFSIWLVAIAVQGQHAQTSLSLSVPKNDRVSVIKTSVRLAEWHEKSFWRLYDKYMVDAVKGYSLTYRSLSELAKTDNTLDGPEAFQNGRNLIDYRENELALRKQYYQEIGGALNGVIALQFLQTEAMMDMIESSEIYGKSTWKKFRFHPLALSEEQARAAKHNILKSALSLSASEENSFWPVYERFEEECNALLGNDYNIYTLFASDAADFTPALAKRLGHDLLRVMERENKLKEKYFLEMSATAGSVIAARFLAWEDYYSLISKMHAWAETP
ncbi:MAG: hypothetical protein ABIR06_12205 [Cyclobacteriaceae bacterium]